MGCAALLAMTTFAQESALEWGGPCTWQDDGDCWINPVCGSCTFSWPAGAGWESPEASCKCKEDYDAAAASGSEDEEAEDEAAGSDEEAAGSGDEEGEHEDSGHDHASG